MNLISVLEFHFHAVRVVVSGESERGPGNPIWRFDKIMADVNVLIMQPSAAMKPPTSAAVMAATAAPSRPASFRIDTAYPAVQVGGGVGRQPMSAALTAALPPGTPNPASFVVRATVDEAELNALDNALANQYGEHVVFADPRIEPAPVCGGDPSGEIDRGGCE